MIRSDTPRVKYWLQISSKERVRMCGGADLTQREQPVRWWAVSGQARSIPVYIIDAFIAG